MYSLCTRTRQQPALPEPYLTLSTVIITLARVYFTDEKDCIDIFLVPRLVPIHSKTYCVDVALKVTIVTGASRDTSYRLQIRL